MGPPWVMMFAADLVLCAMTREEAEEDLKTWRVVFERHGLTMSRPKTKYLPSPTNEAVTTGKMLMLVYLQMTSYKYHGSFMSEEGYEADVNRRNRADEVE